MYLYVERGMDLEHLPEALLKQFGEPESVMILMLSPERKLARVSVHEVISCIGEQGFYLQMPPTTAELLARDRSRD